MTIDVMPTPREPEEKDLEVKALTLAKRATALVVIDAASDARANELAGIVKDLIDMAEAQERPLIKAANNTWKMALEKLAKLRLPLDNAVSTISAKRNAYATEQKRLKAEEDARAAAEQRRLQMEQIRLENEAHAKAEAEARTINDAARRRAEEEQETALALAEAQGATVEEIEAIITAPLVVEIVEAAPVYVPAARYVPPAASVVEVPKGARETWDAKLVSMKLVCAAIGRDEASDNLVALNPVAARALAVLEKKVELSVPGLRGVCTTSVPIRR